MALKLPSKGHIKILHIALFSIVFLFGIQVQAQSVLLPGDVVVVSVNADTQAVDIIPLIDIEEGTELYLAEGSWSEAAKNLSGNEIRLIFLKPVQAGTNLHINNLDDERISISGKLTFQGSVNRLFVYQKDVEVYRFIFAMGWGTGPVWKTEKQDSLGSDIPSALKLQDDLLLTLGTRKNYQYYVRNGASGTRSMLLQYVGDASHWRGNDQMVYSAFGTSFKLLKPPVVLFQNSLSTVMEDDSISILNVAIYEHDGSRLTVDVVFDSLRSISSSRDLNGFEEAEINFTGLVGDAVYEVKVPIIDDAVYEGRESGIFTLRNLTKGNYGDFLTHSLIILDNDLPELQLVSVQNSAGNPPYAELVNEEEVAVSLKNWKIVSSGNSYTFEEDIYIEPQQSLLWVDALPNAQARLTGQHVFSKTDNRFIQSEGGTILLVNPGGKTVSELRYPALKKENQLANSSVSSQSKASSNTLSLGENAADVSSSAAEAVNSKTGWKVFINAEQLSNVSSEIPLYSWDNETLELTELANAVAVDGKSSSVFFGYFDDPEQLQSAIADSHAQNKLSFQDNFEFELSVSDRNGNDRIDRLEGLNLLYNPFDISISVGKLTELILKIESEAEIQPLIYAIRYDTTGKINYVAFENEETIEPDEAFWILIDSPIQEQIVSFNKSDFEDLELQSIADQNEPDLNEGKIALWVEAGDYKDSVEVVITDSVRGLFHKDLNSYPELLLPNQLFLNVAFNSSDEFYNTISVANEMNQKMILPLNIGTSEEDIITFKTSEFERVPPEWKIQLEDKLNGKLYDIRKDALFSFKHTGRQLRAENSESDSPKLVYYAIQDRFYLHLSPPVSGGESEELIEEPRSLELHQNFPNPFNPVTTISFYLPEAKEIKLSVFNIVGQPVAVIAQGSLSAGEHQFEWDATDKPSGMYIYQLEVGKSVMTRKMTLVK